MDVLHEVIRLYLIAVVSSIVHAFIIFPMIIKNEEEDTFYFRFFIATLSTALFYNLVHEIKKVHPDFIIARIMRW